MKKIIAKLMLKILGWKIVLHGDTDNLDRCILTTAPHTHNIDFLYGNLCYMVLDKKLKVIIKDQHTKAWYGWFIKAMGGIGIDRSQKNNLVQFVADEFKKDDFSLVITPEGKRKRADKWKKGFYYMAKAAKVPIVLACGDFKRKIIYIGYHIPYERIEKEPYEVILKEIETYINKYDIQGKIPEYYNRELK
ncbi:MAG: glycerol acyltransferase [Flavobacteriales bacterium]|nr:MAG: glycerol acyltransferase [Flavobacteriales bacterium]